LNRPVGDDNRGEQGKEFVMLRTHEIRIGKRFPAGATWSDTGVNFSIFSPGTTEAQLVLYSGDDGDDDEREIIPLPITRHRTFLCWHVFVSGLEAGTRYNWRVRTGMGSWHTILDPWARAVDDTRWDRDACARGMEPGLRGIVTRPLPPRAPCPPKPLDRAIIYEMHVGGFTRHPNSGARQPGTFASVIEKIPHLKALGVTHVELLPVMAFDEQDAPAGVRASGHHNFWGYSPYGFYAPHPRYAASGDPISEFRAMVEALHAADIGVLLDVVFNHTSEGGHGGPVIHFKAMAGQLFYHSSRDGRFRDYTGCGNTINCNHPLVAIFLVRSLEYWARDLGVDGFRFDLASVFSRGENGEPIANPPLPWNMELSHALIDSPMIAEAWDAAGLYQVGNFPGSRWAEWNGNFRDVMRRFVRGDEGLPGEVAHALAGSSRLYADDGRPPACSINFITCHDGFTLRDLVSYNDKHNDTNGEGNRDGSSNNLSWNCGIEGPTDDPAIRALRVRQARNLFTLLLLSHGTPMILAGDEFLRSQGGNNNTWCQDNPLGWFDWEPDGEGREMFAFLKDLIAFRRRHACFHPSSHLTGNPVGPGEPPDIRWHGPDDAVPDWSLPWARYLGFTLAAREPGEADVLALINMSDRDIPVALPVPRFGPWTLAIDTTGASGAPIHSSRTGPIMATPSVLITPRAILVYESHPPA
jgi:glycogen operon protein